MICVNHWWHLTSIRLQWRRLDASSRTQIRSFVMKNINMRLNTSSVWCKFGKSVFDLYILWFEQFREQTQTVTMETSSCQSGQNKWYVRYNISRVKEGLHRGNGHSKHRHKQHCILNKNKAMPWAALYSDIQAPRSEYCSFYGALGNT